MGLKKKNLLCTVSECWENVTQDHMGLKRVHMDCGEEVGLFDLDQSNLEHGGAFGG